MENPEYYLLYSKYYRILSYYYFMPLVYNEIPSDAFIFNTHTNRMYIE